MILACKTLKGREAVIEELKFTDRLREKFKPYEFWPTDKDREAVARVDGIITFEGFVHRVYEIKCRNMTYDQLKGYNSWLVTKQKIVDGATTSKLLSVPFVGFLWLIPDEMGFVWNITDVRGSYLFNFGVSNTLTQETCNGGEIERENAYLPLVEGKRII